jgi:hypothetical protein
MPPSLHPEPCMGLMHCFRFLFPIQLQKCQTVLDLSGALGQEAGVLARVLGLGSEAVTPRLFTPVVCPAHLAPLALALRVIQAPVFRGHTYSIIVELERPVAIVALEEVHGRPTSD